MVFNANFNDISQVYTKLFLHSIYPLMSNWCHFLSIFVLNVLNYLHQLCRCQLDVELEILIRCGGAGVDLAPPLFRRSAFEFLTIKEKNTAWNTKTKFTDSDYPSGIFKLF